MKEAAGFVFGTFASYAWSNGETTKLCTVFAGGDYTVTVTNDNGCRAAASIAVAEQPLPVLTVQAHPVLPGTARNFM